MTVVRPVPVAVLVVGAAARIAVGVLWLLEGILKHRAGFGAADILLVADGAAMNSRVPSFFAVLGTAMKELPGVFGVAIPALEVLLGALLVVGTGPGRPAAVVTRVVAMASLGTLMLYWSSDQLIAQYPVMAVLTGLVLALPAAGTIGLPLLWRRAARTAERNS